MARTQSTRRITRKVSKQLTDDERASEVMFKDPATLTEAERQSQAFFNNTERIQGIQDSQAARANITKEEIEAQVDSLRQNMGLLPKDVVMAMKKKGKPKGPYKSIYEADTTKETAVTKQAAAPAPGDPIEIDDDNDNNGRSRDQQECEKNPDDQLFSAESYDDNDNNDPDDEYSQSTDDEKKKKKKRGVKEKYPQVPFGIPGILTGQA